MDKNRINLEEGILERIKGKIDPAQPASVKENIILGAFMDFCETPTAKGCEQLPGYLNDKNSRSRFFTGFLSYGILDPLLDDPEVEDIIINGIEPIFVHHAKDGLKKAGTQFSCRRELELLIKKILVFSGKENLKKINNIDLPGMRGRVNIVYSPAGHEVTISKIRAVPLSIIDLMGNGTLNADIAALLWLYIEGLGIRPGNILISGGPGSGKTTLLNALLSFIPFNHHLVVIEDTFELITDWIENASRLESDDDLSLGELVKNSLRMRPERIIVGEVRGSEAQDMMTAMNIGKYCMATLHASTVRETIIRLQSNPMDVPEALVNLVDVFIVMKKMYSDGHIVHVIDEVAESAGLEQQTVLISPLWKYDSALRKLIQVLSTTVYRDRLSQVSGLSGKQILDEISKRSAFLESLQQAQIRSLRDVSALCELYIRDPQAAIVSMEASPHA